MCYFYWQNAIATGVAFGVTILVLENIWRLIKYTFNKLKGDRN